MTKDSILRRISILERTIRPENSLAYKIAKLSARDRFIYEEWQKEQDLWSENHPGDELYITLLQHIEGNSPEGYPSDLPKRIEQVLFIQSEPILKTDSPKEAARKYYDLLEVIK